MQVYLNEITGIADAFVSLRMSKRSWTEKTDDEIRKICANALDARGFLINKSAEYSKLMKSLVKWGRRHITLFRYIDFSVTVNGMHRAGQDDWDAHAKRFGNRILRSSTRLASFGYELSDWYKDKIIPTDLAAKTLNIDLPEELVYNGARYKKVINGYVREDLANEQDVLRGLYMLSIPSVFIFKSDLCEWAHVYKERGAHGGAHPEVKELAETIANKLEEAQPLFGRALFMEIQN